MLDWVAEGNPVPFQEEVEMLQQHEGRWFRCWGCNEWIQPWEHYVVMMGGPVCEGCLVAGPIRTDAGGVFLETKTGSYMEGDVGDLLQKMTCPECFCIKPGCLCFV